MFFLTTSEPFFNNLNWVIFFPMLWMMRACHTCSNLTGSYQVTDEFVPIYLRFFRFLPIIWRHVGYVSDHSAFPICAVLALLLRASFWFNTVLLMHDVALCHTTKKCNITKKSVRFSFSPPPFPFNFCLNHSPFCSVVLVLCFRSSLSICLFPSLRCVWPSRPSAWPVRTAWWRIWRLWRLWDPPPPSALIKPAPWRRTAWLSPTCGSTIRSMRRTPLKISLVRC